MYLMVAPLEDKELRDPFGKEGEAPSRAVPRFPPRPRRKTEPQKI